MRELAVFLFVPTLALAQADRPVPPPGLSPELRQPTPATMSARPAPGVTLGSLRVSLEETPMAAVLKAAGAGVFDQAGEVVWICYTVPGKPSASRLWLMSDGADGSVYGVSVFRLVGTAGAAKRCPSLPARLRPMKFDRGLALGMSAAQVTEKLGEPSRKSKDWWIYHQETRVPSKFQGEVVEFTAFNTLFVHLKDGAVDAVRAYVNTVN